MPGGRGPAGPGVHRGSRRGASTLASGGAKRHQTSLCSFPRIRAPPHPCAQGSPKPAPPCGASSSGQTTSGSDGVKDSTAHQGERRREGERGAGGGRGPRRHSPEPRLVPRQPRRQPSPSGGRPRGRAGLRTSGWPGRSAHRRPAVPGQAPSPPRGRSGQRPAHGPGPRRPQPSQRRGPPRPRLASRHRWACDPPRWSCGQPISLPGAQRATPPREQGTLVLKTTTSYHFTLSFFFLNHEIKLFKS